MHVSLLFNVVTLTICRCGKLPTVYFPSVQTQEVAVEELYGLKQQSSKVVASFMPTVVLGRPMGVVELVAGSTCSSRMVTSRAAT